MIMKAKLKIILPIFLSVLVLIAEAILLFAVNKLQMLPTEYFLILTVLLLLVLAGITLLLVLPGKKRRKVRAIIACILSVLVIAGCAILTHVVGQLYKTMNVITNTTFTTTEYTVYVKAEDPANHLADAKSYTFGLSYLPGDETLDKALSSLNEELGISVSTKSYASIPELINALYFGEVGAIIVDSAYVTLLEDFDLYADFHNRVKAIHTISVTEEVETPTVPPTEPATNNGANNNDTIAPFVLYISGSDTRSAVLARSRSDVNILAVIHPETKQVLLINTPRDYFVPNPSGNGVLDKLTHCGIYGIDCSVNALAGLYDTEIDSYAQINFTGFKTLIDAIGGITVYSDLAFTSDKYSFVVGLNEMDGEKALVFARTRKGLPGGDSARGKNQMKVISAVIDKLSSTGALISNYSEIMSSLQGMFQTNLTTELISSLVKQQLSDMSPWNVQSFAVTGKGSSQITYSMPGQYVYVMIPNEKTVEHASNLIDRVLAGEVLSASDMNLPAN